MISLWTGTLGSGKTLLAVKRISVYASQGRLVITDIRLTPEFYLFHQKRGIDTDQVIKIIKPGDILDIPEKYCYSGQSEKESVKVVLDESAEFLDSYQSAQHDKKLQDFMHFLRMSRHYCIDVEFMVQDTALLQKRVRLLCQEVWHISNMRQFSMPLFGRLPPPWRYMVVTSKWDRFEKVRLSNNNWEFLSCPALNWYKTHDKWHDKLKDYKTFVLKKKKEVDDKMTKQDRRFVMSGFVFITFLIFLNILFLWSFRGSNRRQVSTLSNQLSIPVIAAETGEVNFFPDRLAAETFNETPILESSNIEDSSIPDSDSIPTFKFISFGIVNIDGVLSALFPPPYDIIKPGSIIRDGVVRSILQNYVVVDTWENKTLLLTNIPDNFNIPDFLPEKTPVVPFHETMPEVGVLE